MTAGPGRIAVPSSPRALPRILGTIRPRGRWQEFRLLLIVALTMTVGSVSLGAVRGGTFGLYDAWGLGIYVAVVFGAHLAQVLAGRRTDQILLPAVAMLGGTASKLFGIS